MSKKDARQRVEENNRKIARNLKEWRSSRQPNVTLKQIGEAIGRSAQFAHNLENGQNISAAILYEISKKYEVPFEVFFQALSPAFDTPPNLEQIEALLIAAIDILTTLPTDKPPEKTPNAA